MSVDRAALARCRAALLENERAALVSAVADGRHDDVARHAAVVREIESLAHSQIQTLVTVAADGKSTSFAWPEGDRQRAVLQSILRCNWLKDTTGVVRIEVGSGVALLPLHRAEEDHQLQVADGRG